MTSSVPNYDRFLTPLSKRREPSAIRALMPLVKLPGMISLGGGMPNGGLFPFESSSFRLRSGTLIELAGQEMADALQYSPTDGLPALVERLNVFQERFHHPPPISVGRSLCVTTGSQDALSKALEMCICEGDSVLVEDPTYSGALAALRPLGCKLIGVPTDGKGLIPSKLEEILKNWANRATRPKVLYTIPTGQNPSGATLSNARRREVYRIACEYDLLVLEDDPYYFIHFGDEAVDSLLSIDTEGRVLRFDSFSKVLSSGLRLGFVTGPKPLIGRIQLHQQAASLHCSGLSQAVVNALLRTWGDEGWDAQVTRVRSFYRQQRDAMVATVDRHLKGLVEYSIPQAGMFLWMKLLGTSDTEQLIKQRAVEKKVLLVPGQSFSPNNEPSPFVRASFSVVSPEQMEEAVRRFATLLKE